MEAYTGRALLIADDGEVAAVVDVVLDLVADPHGDHCWTGSAKSLVADWPSLFEIGEMTLKIGERVSRCSVSQPLGAKPLVDAYLGEPPPCA